jgi:hypothetical protein
MTVKNSHPHHLDGSPTPEPVVPGNRQRVRAAIIPPTAALAEKRLAAGRGRAQPWLTSDGLAAARDVPEVMGPKTYRRD